MSPASVCINLQERGVFRYEKHSVYVKEAKHDLTTLFADH